MRDRLTHSIWIQVGNLRVTSKHTEVLPKSLRKRTAEKTQSRNRE